ncbi:MAG: hypothetical protein J6P40_07395 [Oscillospiraceae bacterium]|nr:hypothetical protein [Oscillospiraceae bacterium]
MTIRDLIQQEVDIDVYDDVCEELSIAFVGPQKLTKEGEKEFADIMDYPVILHTNSSYGSIAIVRVDDPVEEVWEERLRKAKRFFDSAAGYCACSDYEKWFEEE